MSTAIYGSIVPSKTNWFSKLFKGTDKLISPQTIILVIGAILVNGIAWGTKAKPFTFGSFLSFILVTLFFAYNTNCITTTQKCSMWGWIQILIPCLLLLSAGVIAGTMGVGTHIVTTKKDDN